MAPAGPFLRNCWYAAAHATEIAGRPFARRICGEPIVVFRQGDGRVAALEDRCPHRRAPLSSGEVIGDEIQCGYHGARFDAGGNCTRIPSQPALPAGGLGVRVYRAVERYALIFVWMGDADDADERLLPDWNPNTADGWTTVYGYQRVKAHYQLVLDNLLDLTHLNFVHKTTLAQPGFIETGMDVTTDGDTVRTLRVMRNVDPAPIHRAIRQFDGKVDRWQTSEFTAPGYIRITLGVGPAGSGVNFDDPSHLVINSVTPESETTTHYFWSVPRRFALGDQTISERFREMTQQAFNEDTAILEAQQRMIESDRSGRPLVNFRDDQAGYAARRIIARKLESEAATAPAPP